MDRKLRHFNFADIAKQAATQQSEKAQTTAKENFAENAGLLNGVFEDSFMTEPEKRKSRFVSITRMDTYTKLNKSDTTSNSEEGSLTTENTGNEAGSPRKPKLSRRGGMTDRTGTLRVALKNRLRKIVEERLTIKQIFKRYVEGSTLHGFRYTCSDTYVIRRVIWAILMILGAIYFLVKLKEGIVEYFEYPFSTLFMVDFVENLTFPAITFCPINSFKHLNNSKLLTLYNDSRLPLNRNWRDPHYDIDGVELNELFHNASVKIEDIFEDCDWIKRDTDHPMYDKNPCGPQDFRHVHADTGEMCFTLNSGMGRHKLLNVSHGGLNFGYELLFDLKVEELLHTFPYCGLKVIVHPQAEPPVMAQGFTIAPGFKTFVAMNKIETKNLPPPYATQCGEIELKYFPTYNQKACLLERLTDHVGMICKCREPFMPDNGLPYCSLRETVLCMLPAKETFDEYVERQNCPIDCEVTSFEIALSDTRYLHDPPKGLEKILLQQQAWRSGVQETHLMRLTETLSPKKLDEYIEYVFYYNVITTSYDHDVSAGLATHCCQIRYFPFCNCPSCYMCLLGCAKCYEYS